MSDSRWQFWIDVGGTFTDCLAQRPDGTLLRHKLLSSGVVKGRVHVDSTSRRIHDPARRADPPEFWRDYCLRLLDHQGRVIAESRIQSHDAATGTLLLESPLSVDPEAHQSYELASGEEAPIVAVRYLMELGLADPVPPISMRLGTTRGTNALITRKGAKTALLTTNGFADVLRIGYQNRPRLFTLAIARPEPLFFRVATIRERIAADGTVLDPLEKTEVRQKLIELKKEGAESLAICLLHAYRYPQHEQQVEQIAEEIGFAEISRSSRVAPLMKIVARGDTTVLDAYLNPVLRSYIQQLGHALRGVDSLQKSDEPPHDLRGQMKVLTSAGGLVDAAKFVGKDSILSGPAGGVVGFSRAAQAAGFDRAIGFDMGGTSTDVSRFDGRFELEYETEKAGVRVVAPMMAIETVAAGGGSLCEFDGVKLAVGPDSAGADPGPACYGRGGPLAVTDVNLMLGKILPTSFPFSLDVEAAERRLRETAAQIAEGTGRHYAPIELANGFLRVANANMAKAIRSISIAKGYDPREYVLVAFGGAAPQHACAIADELGIHQILNHPDAGILSAVGVGAADVVRHRAVGVYRPYFEKAVDELEETFQYLTQQATQEVLAEGVSGDRIHVVRSLDLRYQGVDAFLTIARADEATFAERFLVEHQRLYGYVQEGRDLEIVAARVEVTGRSSVAPPGSRRVTPPTIPEPRSTTTVWFQAQPHTAQVYDRRDLRPGQRIRGPAVVLEDVSTTVVDPGWIADVLSEGELLLERSTDKVNGPQTNQADRNDGAGAPADRASPRRITPPPLTAVEPDPVMLEIFNNHFAGIAEQMGITLRNTSSSVNVKERLDFSCALFEADGSLVVNAPHIPVHLGAMSETVKCVLADNPSIQPGDVFVTNDPYRGGSHLPDITVVTPVHEPVTGKLRFLTASRAHHAEIGGIVPGSMPPFSRCLAEEGVVLHNFKVVAGGRSRIDELHKLLLAGPHPTRDPETNLADIRAQIASNQQGARDLNRLVGRFGWPLVEAYMTFIQEAAERKMRQALARVPNGRHEFVDHLDDGAPICASITIDEDSAIIDFNGTGPVLPGNLNANRAIVTAAVMYCLRCLIDEEIPLNQGVLAPVELILPECLLNPQRQATPTECPAVAGGNVETSQRIVDVILGALGVAAASQGTMNNLLFGDATFGYYETICGGAGATRDCDGADAVHTHMTNTRLTDPEVLEQRYPVRLVEFAIRHGSGGGGRRRGGNGVVRRLEFLRELDVAVLSQRRGPFAPYGLAGGHPGALGSNRLLRRDGRCETLPYAAQFRVQAGDQLFIETPGGGGYGAPLS
jgi:5-oxoprolinase (ATP-hydrolysing)